MPKNPYKKLDKLLHNIKFELGEQQKRRDRNYKEDKIHMDKMVDCLTILYDIVEEINGNER